MNTFVVNRQGIYCIFDIGSGGVSFGCSSERDISERLVIDIADDKGLHLLDLPINKVWVAKNTDFCSTSICDTVVGAKFDTNLMTPDQQSTLNQLMEFLSKNKLQ
ncbi:hypothetical protein [Desulfocastanea catecholica]